MGTKIVSSRIDERKLAIAESLTQLEYGMSFGKYCGSVLVDAICESNKLPKLTHQASEKRAQAVKRLKGSAEQPHNTLIGSLSDEEIRQMIANRYA